MTTDTSPASTPAAGAVPGAPGASGAQEASDQAAATHGRAAGEAQAVRRPPLPYLVRQALPGLAVLVTAVVTLRPVEDPDTFWHLAAGDRLRSTWVFDGPDPWSSMSTRPWRLHEWLPELLMSGVQQVLGLPGVAWLLPLGAVAVTLVLWWVTRRHASLLVVTVVTLATVVAMSQSLTLRPHLVTFALTTVTTGAWLATAKDHRARWWLVPLTWVWACSHGMWFLAVVIGGVVLVAMVLDRRERPLDRRTWLRLAAVPASCLVAAALTPTGPGLLLSPLAVSGYTQYVSEWDPPSITSAGLLVFVGLTVLTILTWARSRRRVPWTQALLLVVALGLALLYARTVAVGAAVLAPVAAGALQDLLPTRPEPVERREVHLTLGLAAVGLALAAALVPGRAAGAAWGAPGLDAALGRLPAGTVVCNDYGLGGWLIWRHPQLRPTIDGRTEVYSVQHVASYVDFQNARPGWTGFLSRTSCRWAVVSGSSPVSEALVAQTHWVVVARDPGYLLLRAPG